MNNEEEGDDDEGPPALLPAGQVGPLVDSETEDDDEEDEEYGGQRTSVGDQDDDIDPPDLASTDDDSSSDDDGPLGLMASDDNESGSEDSDEEEYLFSRPCLTCTQVCKCPVDIASSSEELILGEASSPSASLKQGKDKLEKLDHSFSHKSRKFGRVGYPNDPDSEGKFDPNTPIDWKSLSYSERKKRLCEDLHLHNNLILDAQPAQRDRLQNLVTEYSDIWTDGQSYNALSLPSVPFIRARVILDPAKGPHTPYRSAVRVLSPAQRSGLEEKIRLWLQQGIIEEL